MIKITITLEEALGADVMEARSQVTKAIFNALEQPATLALFIRSEVRVETAINTEFRPDNEPSLTLDGRLPLFPNAPMMTPTGQEAFVKHQDKGFEEFKKPQGVEKTPENECQVRYLGGRWVISELEADHPYLGIDAVIKHINLKQLYITNETIFTEEYAKQLWYKRKN